MLGRLLKFEFTYHTRQIAFWVVIAIMLAFALGTTALVEALGGGAGERNKLNGAYTVANTILSWDTIALFFAAIFTSGALLRDQTFNAVEVVHATPVKTSDMVLSRMIGAYLVVFALISVGTLGTFFGQFFPSVSEEILGPVRPSFYLQPMLLFSAINAAVLVAFFSLVAGLTRSRIITLTSAVAVLAFSLAAGLLMETEAPLWVQAVADPFGSVAYANETEFWSVEERNEQIAPLMSLIGLNRLVWGVLALVGLAAAFTLFKRGLGGNARKSKIDSVPAPTESFRPVKPASGFGAGLLAFASQARLEAVNSIRSIPFAILTGVFLVLYALILLVALFLSPQKMVPTSDVMALIGNATVAIPMTLIIAFFAGEISFRDRTHRMTEILHATRVNDAATVMGRWIAMFALVVLLSLIPAFVGIVVQALADAPPPEIGTYFGYALFSRMPLWITLAAIAMFAQSFAANRIVGIILAFGAITLVTVGIGRLPFAHPLMSFLGASPGDLSEMAGYADWINFRWRNLYSLGIFIALGTLSVWLARRGVDSGPLKRLRSLPRRVSLPSAGVFAAGAALALFAGVTIQQALSSVDFRTRSEREQRQLDFEAKLGEHIYAPIPTVTDVSLLADIYPDKLEGTVSGTMRLTNMTDAPIVDAFVNPATGHPEDVRQFEIDGATLLTDGTAFDGEVQVADVLEFDQEVVRFDPPLRPGEVRKLRFSTYYHPPRLRDGSMIAANGTFMNQSSGAPTFGLNDQRMRDPDKRRKKGLDKIEPMPDRDDEYGRSVNLFGVGSRIMFDGTVCTSLDQIGIAPGRLIETTKDDGRHCRRYKTNKPISNFFAIVSARYDVTSGLWTSADGREVPIEVYHHPSHTYSVDTMIEATKHGLTVFEREFKPYKLDYFRILEIPYIGFAQAFAGTIPFAEQGFVMDAGDPEDSASVDNATATTLHELAHQWFGHELTPGRTQGFNVLSEGLTSYATLLAYEELYGFDKARTNLVSGAIEMMAAKKFGDKRKEVPVAVSELQSYLHYEKPDWILWSLRKQIGAEPVNAALRDLLDEFGEGVAPFATTKDVVAALKRHAPEDYHALIDDQWERIVWWSVDFNDAEPTVTPTADGKFKVTVPYSFDKKINHGEEDRQTSVSEIEGEDLNEWLEVGFYAEKPDKKWSAWQALETVRVTQSEGELSFTLDEEPGFVAFDPRRVLQENNVVDNVVAVKSASDS